MPRRLLIGIITFALPVLASVDVRTNIQQVYHDGHNEVIGSFTLAVNANDFAAATPSEPIYVRFRIVRANGWAKTRVDLRPGSQKDVPINLALAVDGSAIINPGLPADAVQLVRLIRGERDGWIRVNYPTSTWLQVGGFPVPPDLNTVVTISLGIEGEASVKPGASTPTNGNEFDDGSGLANTELCTDYSNTPNFNPGDLDYLDFIAFDSSTVGVEDGDNVTLGDNAGVTFSNDNQIARGSLYVARFEYHVTKDSFNGPAHDLPLNRLNSINIWNWCGPIDPVYYTNTGDFDWEPGTTLFLCLVPYDPLFLTEGEPSWLALDEPGYLADVDIQVTSPESQAWEVEKVYSNNFFVGYALHLQAGLVPPSGRVDVSGLQTCMNNDFDQVDLRLAAYAYVFNDFVTEGEQIRLGPRIRVTSDMYESEPDYYRQVVPFTAYDRDQSTFTTRVVNQADTRAVATAILFNRHGVTLRVHGVQIIQPHGSMTFSIPDLFGAEAKGVLAWMEILSDQPVAVSGILEDYQRDTFDVFAGVDQFQETLYLPHIPSLPDFWETRAYVLSGDLDADAQFYLQLPNNAPTQMRAILIPGATAVLDDDDFGTGANRAAWLQVNATSNTGAGLAVFDKKGSPGQIATLPLMLQPQLSWQFDHVGNRNNKWWNGLVLCNPNNVSSQVLIAGYDAERNLLAQDNVEVGPQARIAAFVRDLVPSEAPISSLVVTSDVGLVAFLLTGIDDNDQLTTIAGNLPESTDLSLPYLPASIDSWVGLSLVNPKSQRAAISLRGYDKNGQPSPDIFLDIAAGSKRVLLLSDVLANASQYTHLSISSNVAIRGFALIGNLDQSRLATVNLVAKQEKH